ncbi:hypothetical protein RRG08_035798 [Elysia crispata]|uniref:Uncharacterized protein n=1 Tax=Elysia crispata TaxID=231223 RepID=A0AAE0ZM52_9GAST|nr:hypothetical protein RRG08_035798 [Elysia crispata]
MSRPQESAKVKTSTPREVILTVERSIKRGVTSHVSIDETAHSGRPSCRRNRTFDWGRSLLWVRLLDQWKPSDL